MRRVVAPLVLTVAAVAFASCGADGESGESGTPPTPCDTAAAAIPFIETSCAIAPCHLPGLQFPDLTRAGLAKLPGMKSKRNGTLLLTNGDPAASFLYRKVSEGLGGDDGALMPLGSKVPRDEAKNISDWILQGAPTDCDIPLQDQPPVADPNSLDQGALFTCNAPTVDSSPERLRRVGRREWTHAVVKPDADTNSNSIARDNPLVTPRNLQYSTFTRGVSIDEATLDLFMLALPEAPALWTKRNADQDIPNGFSSGTDTWSVYSNPALNCMLGTAMLEVATMTTDCIDTYVDTLLRHGVLFRTPTDGERTRMTTLLTETLKKEDPTDSLRRRKTLHHVGQAAFLMGGALFRSEAGEPVVGDPAGRRRLTPDELALALGNVLDSHPVGSPLPVKLRLGDPDEVPALGLAPAEKQSLGLLGRLGLIRAKADLGEEIYSPAVIHEIFEKYQGGKSPYRHDLDNLSQKISYSGKDEKPGTADDVFIRGEYWVGDRVQEFFREWLDYKAANTSFKDHPGSTSQWHVPDTKPDRYEDTNRGYTNLQNGFYGHESTLVEQLDDTVARAVVESHANGKANGTNVFHELMTTRMWRLPSNVVNTNEIKCTDNSGCETCMPLEPNMPNVKRYCLDSTGNATTKECNTDSQCYSRCTTLGLCGSSISSNTTTTLRPYNLTGNIEHTSEARWHEMPLNERRGVLTHPAWLGAHGGNFQDDASAVGRGRWIRENLFCESVPGLELVMVEAKLIASDSTRSARDRLVTSVENEVTCMGCHSKMNSLGYPFEIYNHAGFVRTWDHIAEPPDNQGEPDGRTTIDNLPDTVMNTDFTSALDFIDAIADSPYARRCFIRQAFRFFMGRDEVLSDACTLTAMDAALNSDGSFFSMLEVLVGSESFQYRSDASEGGTR